MRQWLSLFLFLTAQTAAPVCAAAPIAPQPHEGLAPAEAVKIQLDAFQRNGAADIALIFSFASPGNRNQTGPLERFTRMLRGNYAEMFNHRSARLSATVMQDGLAYQGVELTARNGRTYQYVFVLARQPAAPCAGCWLTDAVLGNPASAEENPV